MKYIDADKLIAEIERVKAEKTRIYEMLPKDDLDAVLSYAQRECLQQLGYFITSLQQEQPEVDLEKEIARYLREECSADNEPSISEIARHFYELGRARKEK